MNKRVISAILAMSMVTSLFAGCGSKPASSASTTSATGQEAPQSEKKTQFGLKPFAEKQTLNIGFFGGSAISFPFYIADKEGFFKELNIDVNYEVFTNGPAMMEASADWDMAVAGAAGTINGQVGHDIPMIGICDYEVNQGLFVRADSPIAKHPDDPAVWKGTTWLYPNGTTAHLAISKKLELMGLKESDIKSVNMDVSSALTAFKGGEGDGIVVWHAIALQAEDNGYIRVADAGTVGATSASGLSATKKALTEKRELVKTAYMLYYLTWEWCKSSDANMKKAAEYFLESCEDEGIACDASIAERIMNIFKCPTLDESIKLMTETVDDPAGLYKTRKMLRAEADLFKTLDFFISRDKFTNADREKILNEGLVDASIVNEIKDMAVQLKK